MISFARQFSNNFDDADDAAQESFKELYEVVTKRLKKPNAVAAGFMYKRVKWRARDIHQDRRRQPTFTEEFGDSNADDESFNEERASSAQEDDTPSVEDIVLALKKKEDIRQLIMELRGRNREIGELLVNDERQVDIAKEFGISKERVNQVVKTIWTQLRPKLIEKGWECNETIGMHLNF
jgi:RNA polymerase sigma factor (sigma-70 family)